jgi:hypothetical protein
MSNFLTFRAANPIGCTFPIIIMIMKTFIGKIIHIIMYTVCPKSLETPK